MRQDTPSKSYRQNQRCLGETISAQFRAHHPRMTQFLRYRVWAAQGSEQAGIWCYSRTPQEAADESFLDFVDMCDPPSKVELACREEHKPGRIGQIAYCTVYPSFRPPFVVADRQPELGL